MADGSNPNVEFDHEVANRINKQLDIQLPGDQPKGLKSIAAGLAIPFAEQVVRSETDPLTGLHRKEYYQSRLEEELNNLSNGQIDTLGVIRMDLDYFSWVNDILKAHALGDLYLATTGSIIRHNLRIADVAVRVGGDEIVVIELNPANIEGFTQSVKRYHDLLNGKILEQTLHIAAYSDRVVIDRISRLEEREGTIAIKEYLKGLVAFKNNSSSQTAFLDRGRGEVKKKVEFIKRVNDLDLDRFNDYISSDRVWNQLSEEEKAQRRLFEVDISKVICDAMSNLSISMAGMFVTREDNLGFPEIDSTVDKSVNEIKEKHGGGVFYIYKGTHKETN